VLIRFLTATPLDVRRGSGTFVGIDLLRRSLLALGHEVTVEGPRLRLPVFTAERYLYNLGLRADASADLTVGFDMDGYRIAASAGHVVALKGVIADEARFERGWTRASMQWQARCEREHCRRAARVIATSRYSADAAREFYGLAETPAIAPEAIDLAAWQALLAAHAAPAETAKEGGFTVLSVGRLYRRKRIERLLEAAALLRGRIDGLRVRIIGRGPQAEELAALGRALRLEGTVEWLGDVSRAALAREYAGSDVFCHPSVQEGFGIVFLEAMAAGKAIVAARAGAAPEVAPDALLAEPDDAASLADALAALAADPARRARLGAAGLDRVRRYDARQGALAFLRAAGVG
jgi:glycosyltransferase involved in cell wall biosynthesis